MSRRFALYFAPPQGSELEAFGRSWLGRDHITGKPVDRLRLDGLDHAEQARITRSASHYGFHATLKAPFELAAGRHADELYERGRAFAAARQPFHAPSLKLTRLSKWVALTLSAPCLSMDQLAADCVRDFDSYRAPLSEADIERRRKSGLSPRQDQQLLAYGYPYIFDDFHFHMTLAGPLDTAEQDRIHDFLLTTAKSLERAALLVDALSIYEQADRDQPFIQTARLPFGARQSH